MKVVTELTWLKVQSVTAFYEYGIVPSSFVEAGNFFTDSEKFCFNALKPRDYISA